jgi:ketosteroid isomerase-like protein
MKPHQLTVFGALFLLLGACNPKTSDQRAVEARTSRLLEAVRHKDTASIERLQAPEFTWVVSPDQVLNRTQARDFLATSFSMFQDFSEFQYSMGPVRIAGDTAVAVVLIRAVFTSRDPSGSSHVLAQTASHEDTWIRRAGQWLLARDRVLEIGSTRDVQPYDPLADQSSTQRR